MILGIDAGSRTVAEAERLLHEVVKGLGLPADIVGCTHFVRFGTPHVACSVTVEQAIDLGDLPGDVGIAFGESRTGPEDLAEGAALAAAEHAAGTGGRVVAFPGQAELTGTVSVGEVTARSAVDRVVVLAQAGEPAAGTLLVTNDHIRPEWRDGHMTLVTMPASGGRLMPAEVPNPTPCCADHG
ncbi:hypothetical protein [Streptosporangium sp. NPDC087985]|uniref:hypothetical protein n=1 Tax=Streptosporangium sp. NPDC087985 TaxID=3366196 RepID=UPI003810036A